jgi:hypothetical protein
MATEIMNVDDLTTEQLIALRNRADELIKARAELSARTALQNFVDAYYKLSEVNATFHFDIDIDADGYWTEADLFKILDTCMHNLEAGVEIDLIRR